MITNFAELRKHAKTALAGKAGLRIGVILPTDPAHIEAILEAVDDGLVKPTLFGPALEINKLLDEAVSDSFGSDQVNIGMEIIDCATADNAARKALESAQKGELDILLKAGQPTRELVDLLYDKQIGFAGKKETITHIGVLQHNRYHKLMLVSDGAVIAEPDAAAKMSILTNAASLAHVLEIETPKAALLAAAEGIYPAVPVSMEEAALAKMADRGQIKGVLVDGPLSFDIAISADVAKSKGLTGSPVAGDTDIFVPPTMSTANGVYKAMVHYAGAEAAGIIYGARVPIATASAVDTSTNILNSIALSVLVAEQ
ncbi:MAG: phosphate acetyltransferase [candidate division Zixibacteria bacterium]|nr:phosphate acetyltransferase [candidate division Zixibacteria bacterium]